MQATEWVDRQEYPFTDHYLNLPMGRMHYIDEGQGRPLVMVHGTPEWSFGWRHLVKALSKDYRCITCDHIGFGLSDKPAGWSYLPEDHARNLAALIETLGLTDLTLIAHDYGGPIGLAVALDHPQAIHSIVAMNTWLWSLDGDPHFTGTRMFAGRVGKFLYQQLAFSPRVMLPLAMGDRSKLTPAIHAHYLKPWRTPAERHSTWVLARELIGSSRWYDTLWQRRAALQNIPALILWGMKDMAFRAQELEKLKTVFNHPSVVTFNEIGHFVAEELGTELAPIILQFLENVPNSA
jgi:haloalkane dehalogenase